MRIEVDCVRTANGDNVPARLSFNDRSLAVAEIMDSWPGGNYRYFKVKSEDGALYILRHDETHALWELTMFQRPSAI